MANIHGSYGRDLDLNLLRVFLVVADARSVTRAAERLYLTQPAVSAAIKRLDRAVGASLFARQGRGLVLTARGAELATRVRPHLEKLVRFALSPGAFDAKTSERTIRLGLSDAAEMWLLPPLLRWLEREAPRMTLVAVPVQFRTVGDALASERVDVAVTVADDLPTSVKREALFVGSGFVCLYHPRRVRLPRRLTTEQYLAHEHVVVSYNGDTRGVVEDMLGLRRRVRCSVSSFQTVGVVVDGTAMLATVPAVVAHAMMMRHPRLRIAELPFAMGQTPLELLWRGAVDDDDAQRFVRGAITALARGIAPQRDARADRARASRTRRARGARSEFASRRARDKKIRD